jgi:predicted DCC family thiol-disulfide oxidoreductase YuxK
MSEGEAVVLYDADCGFCRWSLGKILAWDRAKRLRPVPIESEEGDRLLVDLSPEARHGSWHLVTADGTRFSAGAAAAPLVALLPGGRPLAAVFRAFPGTTERAYSFVVRRRGRWARLLRIDESCDVPCR